MGADIDFLRVGADTEFHVYKYLCNGSLFRLFIFQEKENNKIVYTNYDKKIFYVIKLIKMYNYVIT